MIDHVRKCRVCSAAILIFSLLAAGAIAQTANVIDVTPAQNSLDVSPSANIIGEFDLPLDPVTVQGSGFTAFGNLAGRVSGTVTYSDVGGHYLLNFGHASPFRVGERVQACLSSQIHGGDPFSPVEPFAWQFNVKAPKGSGTFDGLTHYAVPSGSWSMIPLDIENDLDMDLIVTSKYSSMIGIFWNKGDGTFFEYQGQNTINYPITINAADLNGDGFQDLMIFGQTWDSLAIMLNTGHATFEPYYSVWMGHAYPFEVDAADFDGDGDLDIMAAAVYGGDSVVVCFNDGTGSFPLMYSSYPTGGTSPAVAKPADVDNDGDWDIVVVHGMSANIAVLPNSGGSFGAPILYAIPQGGLSLDVVDVTGDGYVDAIVAPTNGDQLIVLNNNGDGTFPSYDTYTGEEYFSLVRTGDVDGDGDQDIVASYQGSDFVSVFFNDGGTFTNKTSYPTLNATDWIAIADFDGDDDLDFSYTMGSSDSIGVIFNTDVVSSLAVADAQPAPHSISVPTSATISVAFTTDVDMSTVDNSTLTINSETTGKYTSTYSYDGLERRINCSLSDPLLPGDLITVTVTGGVKALNGDSVTHGYSWSFTTATQPASATSFRQVVCSTSALVPFDIEPIDFDVDYDADIVVAGYQVSVLRNDGSLSFDEQSVDTLYLGSFDACTADLNGDGYPDIVAWNNNTEYDDFPFGILINNGDGTFTGDTLFPNTALYIGMAAADFDNDGDIDLAATNAFYSRQELIFWNNGNAEFTIDTVADIGFVSSDGEDPCVTDVDNDGLLDILMLNWSGSGFTVVHNDGGSFSVAGTYNMGNYSEHLAAADLNGDHYPDVVGVSNSLSGPLSVVFSDGSGGFDIPMIYDLEGDRPLDVELADIDGDGDNDVIMSSYISGVEAHVHIRLNDGTGVLSQGPVVPSFASVDQLCSADFDNDGDLDLAATAMSESQAVIVFVNSNCHDYDHDGYSDPGWPGDECAADNCPLLANPLQEDADLNGIGDACQFSETVIQGDPTVDVGAGVEVTFSNVMSGGTVDLTVTTSGPTTPGGYTLVPSAIPTYYDLITDAGTSDPMTVCITYDDAGMAPADEETIVLLHWDGSEWVDITTGVDTSLNKVCGTTPTLSPFMVGLPQSSCCGLYTGGYTGNTDCDVDGKMNLADVTKLIDRIYLSKDPLCCEENGNVDGDIDGKMNLADITKLIDHIYLSKQPTAACP